MFKFNNKDTSNVAVNFEHILYLVLVLLLLTLSMQLLDCCNKDKHSITKIFYSLGIKNVLGIKNEATTKYLHGIFNM